MREIMSEENDPFSDPNSEWYKQGWEAAESGKKYEDNPYWLPSRKKVNWSSGFNAYKKEHRSPQTERYAKAMEESLERHRAQKKADKDK